MALLLFSFLMCMALLCNNYMIKLLSLVPRPYFFLLLSPFIHKSLERHSASEAAKKEMGVQLRKSKAWFGKSRDPQGFL